jgi:BolA protein
MPTDVETAIETKLRAAFSPERLAVINDSHLHAGHAGSPGTGTSHFTVEMTSAAFEGQGRVARQRAVYQALAEELAGPVHALALKLRAPSEAGAPGAVSVK